MRKRMRHKKAIWNVGTNQDFDGKLHLKWHCVQQVCGGCKLLFFFSTQTLNAQRTLNLKLSYIRLKYKNYITKTMSSNNKMRKKVTVFLRGTALILTFWIISFGVDIKIGFSRAEQETRILIWPFVSQVLTNITVTFTQFYFFRFLLGRGIYRRHRIKLERWESICIWTLKVNAGLQLQNCRQISYI